MSTTNTSGTTVKLEVAHRNFIYMRGFAVKNTTDALIELITNAVDAYRKIEGYEDIQKKIKVHFYHVKNDDGTYRNYVSVIDNAVGVSPENMRECFLTAGNLTADDNSRGFFSTGAKNITALGDAHFTSIKNGKMSKVYLDMDGYGHIVTHGVLSDDESVVPDVVGVIPTQKQREILGIMENGLNVTIEYMNEDEITKINSPSSIQNILNNLQYIGTLRQILSDTTYDITYDIRTYDPHLDILNTDNIILPTLHTDFSLYDPIQESGNYGGQYLSRITYTYPKGDILLSSTFKVPEYEDYTCTFVIYKSDVPIKEPATEKQMEFGFLIKDSSAVYEVNTLLEKYRWNPNIKYLYGFVSCDGFRQELLKSDTSNTISLMDPNRTGMNHDHPLYQSIMSICTPRLDKAVLEVQQSATYKSINIDELDTIVNKLENLGVSIFGDDEVSFDFIPDSTSDIAMAIKSTENHVIKEIEGDLNLRSIASDSITLENLENQSLNNTNPENFIYYHNQQNKLVDKDVSDIIENTNYNPKGNNSQDDESNFLQGVSDDINDISLENPFIFRMKDGEWNKVKVFVKGRIERSNIENDSLLKIKHKSLTIKFINDINYKEKYLIDTTAGVAIKINLHNEVVARKLSKTSITDIDENYSFKLSDEASYDALNFLETLITSAFTDIIVSNDIQSGLIDTTDVGATTAKKIVQHRTKVEAEIEPTIDELFNSFIVTKKNEMKDTVKKTVEVAKQSVISLFLSNATTIEEVELQAERLGESLEETIIDLLYQ
jgi:hypothetical protein